MKKKILFKNYIFSKKELKNVIYDAFINYGRHRTAYLADEMKELGFHYATKAGISISLEDLKIPPTKKDLLLNSNNEILNSDLAYKRGEITSVERFQKIIDTWNKTSDTLKNNLIDFFRQTDPLNSIYLMSFSGARGNLSQVRQLIGMRGLMSDPNGQIMDIPIIHNFREGLTITDYIMSAYGARKGVVDTALRTADSGYLTRRLIDVVQDVIIRENDCLTRRSVCLYKKNNKTNFFEKILGRTSAKNIYSAGKLILKKNEEINNTLANIINNNKINSLNIRSPLTCESIRSVCKKCYGWNLAYGNLVSLGEAVGIIAAQSIGEPGTQLTMRTFHTGGIFTNDSSRQIRAKKTGIFYFNLTSEIKMIRTVYGNTVYYLEKDITCYIIDYKNIKSEINLSAESTIFIKNKSFVKEGDLIAELVIKNKQILKAKKNIIAVHSGEIIRFQNEEILWILEGDVYNLPYNGLFNKFNFDNQVKINDNFLYLKVKATKEGITQIIQNKNAKYIEILKITKCLNLLNNAIFWDNNYEQSIIKFASNEYYALQKVPKFSTMPFRFCNTSNNKYITNMGGQVLYLDKSFVSYNNYFKRDIIKKNGQILFLPIETHVIERDNSLALVANKTQLIQPICNYPLMELFVNRAVSELNGFIETKEENQFLEAIYVKPGDFFEYRNLKKNSINDIKNLNKKIFFPNEIIFDDVLVEYLTFIEIKKIGTFYGILLRPIQEFNISKAKKLIKNNYTQLNSISFECIKSLNYAYLHNSKWSLELVESSIWITKIKNENKIKPNIVNYILPSYKNNSYLAIISESNIKIWDFLSKNLTSENLKFTLCINNFDYVEHAAILGFISIIPQKLGQIKTIKKVNKKNVKFLLIKNDNFKEFYTETNLIAKNKNGMLHFGDIIIPKLKLMSSGKIISKTSFKLYLHKSTPIFLSQNTTIIKKNGDFVKKDELLGRITFEQIITGDIIQGLPKVEEILEARKPTNSNEINFFKHFAFIANDGRIFKSDFFVNSIDNSKEKYYFGQYSYIGKYDKTKAEGYINPHELLAAYFEFYKKYENMYEASYKSLKNIQILLIEKVQQVYCSQGVLIADKHIEIIVKRMTSKVRITRSGSSLLLLNECLELNKINYINNVLEKTLKNKVIYEPILLGISKASLGVESFLSAVSFQETTKILTSAALEGKIDWIRGLKENVIIGRLIPAGIGFCELLKINK